MHTTHTHTHTCTGSRFIDPYMHPEANSSVISFLGLRNTMLHHALFTISIAKCLQKYFKAVIKFSTKLTICVLMLTHFNKFSSLKSLM